MTPRERFSVTLQSVVDAFNAHSKSYGYGTKAKSYLPVYVEELTEANGVQQNTPTAHCRHIAALIVSRHLTIPDALDGEHHLMTHQTIAKLFERSALSIWRARRWACEAIQSDPYAAVYRLSLENMRKAGVEPFGTPRACK